MCLFMFFFLNKQSVHGKLKIFFYFLNQLKGGKQNQEGFLQCNVEEGIIVGL